MKKKLVNSQLTSYNTYLMYRRRLLQLAENVFKYENFPKFIDISYFNQTLLLNGSIAFFKDDVIDEVIALPWEPVGKLDIYGRPMKIRVRAYNGTYYRYLNNGEFVIMYDNTMRTSIYIDIIQIAERIALNKRTIDVNIVQQRTPRVWKTTTEMQKTVEGLSTDIDGFMENVTTFDTLDIDELQCVLAPAPYVADKVGDNLDKEWSEFYQLVGISHVRETKKERLITDEVKSSLGGTIASRFSRFTTRAYAIDKINEKWGLDIKVAYYDDEPTMEEEEDDYARGDVPSLSTDLSSVTD